MGDAFPRTPDDFKAIEELRSFFKSLWPGTAPGWDEPADERAFEELLRAFPRAELEFALRDLFEHFDDWRARNPWIKDTLPSPRLAWQLRAQLRELLGFDAKTLRAMALLTRPHLVRGSLREQQTQAYEQLLRHPWLMLELLAPEDDRAHAEGSEARGTGDE